MRLWPRRKPYRVAATGWLDRHRVLKWSAVPGLQALAFFDAHPGAVNALEFRRRAVWLSRDPRQAADMAGFMYRVGAVERRYPGCVVFLHLLPPER